MLLSVPSTNVSLTSDNPYSEIDRIIEVFGMPFMPFSTGTVMSRSTSSALCPGHWVTMSTIGGDKSGYASIGRRPSAHQPAPITTSVMKTTTNRCLNDEATIRFIIEAVCDGDPVSGRWSLIGPA